MIFQNLVNILILTWSAFYGDLISAQGGQGGGNERPRNPSQQTGQRPPIGVTGASLDPSKGKQGGGGGGSPKGASTQGTICESLCLCKDNQANCNQRGLKTIPSLAWPVSGLSTAIFDKNSITTLQANAFNKQGAKELKGLSVSSSKLTKIKAGAFNGLSNMRELLLNSNKLSKLESGAFDGLRSLEVFKLEKNKLKEFNAEEFNKLTSLNKLYLDDNNLKFIPIEFFERAQALSLLSLGRNPWKCNCKLLGLFLWLSRGSREIEGNPTCSEPEKFKGQQLSRFSFKDVQSMCADPWDDDPDEDEEEDGEMKRLNESCSEHTSDEPLHICFISENVYTSPGKHICLHCAGTSEESEDYELDDPESKEKKMETSWEIPDSANISLSANRFTTHDNGTLCISNIQVADGGSYVCTITLGNLTESDTVVVNVASLAMKVAVGVVVGVVASFVAISAILLRWWLGESGAGDISQVVPVATTKN